MDRLKEIKGRYKKNENGAVVRPAATITSVDKKAGVITCSTSNAMVFSQEIEDIHWLVSQVEELREKAWKYDELCK